MAGRTLLYGLAGQPLVTESEIKEETLALLVEAFGFASALLWARAKTHTQIEMLMDEARQKIIQGVLAIDGAQKAIEQRFDVVIGMTPDGQLVVRPNEEKFDQPPGVPLGQADLYR